MVRRSHARTWETKINFSTSANFGWKFLFFSLFARRKWKKIKGRRVEKQIKKRFSYAGGDLVVKSCNEEWTWIFLNFTAPQMTRIWESWHEIFCDTPNPRKYQRLILSQMWFLFSCFTVSLTHSRKIFVFFALENFFHRRPSPRPAISLFLSIIHVFSPCWDFSHFLRYEKKECYFRRYLFR